MLMGGYMGDYIHNLFTDTLILDTETTSLDFKEAEIIQYAATDTMSVLNTILEKEYKIPSTFHMPSKAITPEISAITTITNRMVFGCPNFRDTLDTVQEQLNNYKYFVAHNAYYDKGVLEAQGLTVPQEICTLRLARKLFADDEKITQHSLQYLRYARNLPIPDSIPSHLADADVMVVGALFADLITETIIRKIVDPETGDIGKQLIEWLAAPVITTIMPFGKHKGKKFTEVPISYWQWALDNFDSLNEEDAAYDKDFSMSVAIAIEEILEAAGND